MGKTEEFAALEALLVVVTSAQPEPSCSLVTPGSGELWLSTYSAVQYSNVQYSTVQYTVQLWLSTGFWK